MELEKIFNDSIDYTREAFSGQWKRWLTFILLSLPFALVRFVIDPEKLGTPEGIHWEAVRWDILAALILLGILASIFIAGYTVRIYRGMKPAPDFTSWGGLFVDGIKLDIVAFVWFLPATILMLLGILIALGGLIWPGVFASAGSGFTLLAGMILLMVVSLVLFVIAALYAVPGGIRFSRTGSMIEGWRYSALTEILRRIGWGNYIIALIILSLAVMLFNLLASLPAVIPYVGWLVPLCLSPLVTVFSARFYVLLYETGEPQPPAATPQT